jgi:hypothetical protein
MTKGQTIIYKKTTQKTKDLAIRTTLKTGGELRRPGRQLLLHRKQIVIFKPSLVVN